jgi:hypothetical protein
VTQPVALAGDKETKKQCRSMEIVAIDTDGGEKCQSRPRSEPKVKKTAKESKTIRANKRKGKLRAKHRRQRARAGA